MPKGTTSKETVETRSYDKQFFMGKFPELLDRPTYIPSFIKIGLGIQKLIGGIHKNTHGQTAT
jgi:hypothetical protein